MSQSLTYNDSLRASLRQSQTDNSILQAKLSTANTMNSKLETHLSESQANLCQVQAENTSLKNQLSSTQADHTILEEHLVMVEGEYKDLETKIDHLHHELSVLANSLKQLHKTLDQCSMEKAELQINNVTLQQQVDEMVNSLKELTNENLRLKSEITALHSHSTQSIPFTQSQSQHRQGTEQKQLPFLVTGSHQVLVDTTCSTSFSNSKGHNVGPTLVGQRFSLATSPDSSGPDVEHTSVGQSSSLTSSETLNLSH